MDTSAGDIQKRGLSRWQRSLGLRLGYLLESDAQALADRISPRNCDQQLRKGGGASLLPNMVFAINVAPPVHSQRRSQEGGLTVMKKLLALIVAAIFALAIATPAVAHQPTAHHHGGGGLTGNEGQPGHHGGPQHNP